MYISEKDERQDKIIYACIWNNEQGIPSEDFRRKILLRKSAFLVPCSVVLIPYLSSQTFKYKFVGYIFILFKKLMSATTPLPLRNKLGYGLGDLGQNILFQAATIYLLNFYTDFLLLDAAFVGTLFLLARIWDGINDPIMGYLAQRTRTRWGTYRPYLLFAAFPLALSMVLLFYVPDLDKTGTYVYATIVYLFFGMAFTAFNVPYGILTAVMTTEYHERGRLTGFRMTFAMLGGIIAAYLFIPLSERLGAGEKGYFFTALIFSMIILAGSLISFASIREKTSPTTHQERISLKESFSLLRFNRPFWQLCLMFGCCFAALGVFSATVPYYFDYVVGNKAMAGLAMLYMMGTTAISIPFWTWLSGRIGKKKVFLFGTPFYLLAWALIFLLEAKTTAVLFPLLIIQGIGNGCAAYCSWAMLPDTIEYGQWKTSKRLEGSSYGVFGFCFKLGLGVGAALTGIALGILNYEAGVSQPEEVLTTIRLLLTGAPFVFIFIAWITAWFYPITESVHREIRKSLSADHHLKIS